MFEISYVDQKCSSRVVLDLDQLSEARCANFDDFRKIYQEFERAEEKCLQYAPENLIKILSRKSAFIALNCELLENHGQLIKAESNKNGSTTKPIVTSWIKDILTDAFNSVEVTDIALPFSCADSEKNVRLVHVIISEEKANDFLLSSQVSENLLFLNFMVKNSLRLILGHENNYSFEVLEKDNKGRQFNENFNVIRWYYINNCGLKSFPLELVVELEDL